LGRKTISEDRFLTDNEKELDEDIKPSTN